MRRREIMHPQGKGTGAEGGGSVKTSDRELAALFSQAELAQTCLVTHDARIRSSLQRQVESGKVVRPARGVYARASYWRAITPPQRMLHLMRSLQALHPDWTFCHESAAVAFGLSVPFERLGDVHVATSRANRTSSTGTIRWHVVERDEFVFRQGLRVTSLPRTTFDCMRTARFGHALAVADSALRLTGSRPSSFVSQFRRISNGHAGTRHAIRTMYCADAQSESGGESLARAAMIEQGFALPRLQVALPQPMDGERSFRVDFLWTRLDGSHVIGEFDGMQKYEDASLRNGRSPLRVLADEQHRESQLTLYGMPIARFSYYDVLRPAVFASILDRYGIPRSDEIARAERRLARSKSASALLFTVENFAD